MTVLGVSSIGSAQAVITVQGALQGVDCQANAVALTMPDGVHVLAVTRYTAAFIDSTPVSLCTLAQYVGSNATVSLTASESQFVAGQIVVHTVPQPAPPAPAAGYAAPSYPYAPSYAAPYCYAPYPGPYYGPPYCYSPYVGYYYPYPAYYYGPPFSIGIGVVLHPGPWYYYHR